MKQSKLGSLLSLFMIATLVLVACSSQGSTPTATTAPAAAQPTTAPTAAAQPTTAAAPTTAATAAAQPTAAGTTSAQPTAGATAAAPVLSSSGIDCMGAKKGDTLSMLYQWSGEEETSLMSILKPLVDACGITLQPESTRDQGLLDTRVKAGTPPDIAFWQVTTLKQYVNKLVPMTDLGVNASNYSDTWKTAGTVSGKWLGLPVKTDIKTIIWYSPTNFKALNYTVPGSWDDLNTLVEKMVSDGQVPWSTGFESGNATGWTGADFIEDIMLVQQGPKFVSGLIDGTVKYNDPGVKLAFQTYGKWAMNPKYDLGGAQGTLATNYNDAIYKLFSDPPGAMMDRQSGFAGGAIKAQFPSLNYPADFDFFGVPGAKGMQIGADWMMSFTNKPAAKALVAYLSSSTGAQNWAKVGFDLTPNTAGVSGYTDPLLLKKAQLLNSATDVVPSIGDMIPGGFDNALWSGIVKYINGGNLDSILSTLATTQAQDVGK